MSSERAARAGVPAGHSRPAIVLHWLVATGVLIQFGLGWWMRTLPDKTGVQAYWFNLHKSVGLSVFALALAMLIWRLRPPPPATHSSWREAPESGDRPSRGEAGPKRRARC